MSSKAARIARIRAELAKLDEVMLVMLDEPPTLLSVIGGSEQARADAVRSWYARHRGVQPTPEHRLAMRAGRAQKVPGARSPRRVTRSVPAARSRRPGGA